MTTETLLTDPTAAIRFYSTFHRVRAIVELLSRDSRIEALQQSELKCWVVITTDRGNDIAVSVRPDDYYDTPVVLVRSHGQVRRFNLAFD